MKKVLLSCFALAALAPGAAFAFGIDVTWNDCGTAGAQNKVFNCTQTPTTANTNFNLYFQAKPDQDLADAVAAECYADLKVPGPIGTNTSPSTHPQAFWQYQSGGCAQGGVTPFDVLPANCAAGGYTDLSDGDGSGASEGFGYREDWNGTAVALGQGRLLGTVARDASLPIAVTAGQNMWILELRFNNRRRATCPGCDQPAVIEFQEAIIRGASGTAVSATFGDKASNCATINGGTQSQCDQVPVQNTTWGRIKALYR